MRCPSAAEIGFLVDLDLGAWQCEWGPIVVKLAMDLHPGGEMGVDAGISKKV